MAFTFCTGEEANGRTALENPERYSRVEYSQATPSSVNSTDAINKMLTEKLTARKVNSFFMKAAASTSIRLRLVKSPGSCYQPDPDLAVNEMAGFLPDS